VSGKAFVVVGSQVRLDRGGLSAPAPLTVEALLRQCHAWAAEVGWSIAASPSEADALIVGPGIAPPPLDVPLGLVRKGQGIDGFRWALRHVAFTAQSPAEQIAYGDGPEHIGDLRRPAAPGPHRLAMLLHGGFWTDPWRRDLMDGVAVDLTRRGWATWNVEYRRVGSGGGWPATGNDVLEAIDAIDRFEDLTGDVILVGHSAGAQLALWAAGKHPRTVAKVVSLAGLTDLDVAARHRLGGGAVERLIESDPPSVASPIDHLPLGVPAVLAHVIDDPVVPVDQSRRYAMAARAAGDQIELIEVEGADHMSLIDPAGAWQSVVDRL
jgi:acetyl esterase/lipase